MKTRVLQRIGLTLAVIALVVAAAGCPRPRPVEVTLTPDDVIIKVGEQVQLTASSTNNQDAFNWESSDPAVASVSATGLVTGEGIGEATIKATGTVSNVSAEATVTVQAAVDEDISKEFSEALETLNSTPPTVIEANIIAILIGLLEESQKELLMGQPCPAADVLDEYLAKVQEIREDLMVRGKSGHEPESLFEHAEFLYAQARALQYDVVASAPAKTGCANRPRFGLDPQIEVEEQSQNQLQAKFAVGEPRVGPILAEDGRIYTQVVIPGLAEESDDPGVPGTPVIRKLVAIPPGAEVSVQATAELAESIKVQLLPFREQPVDQLDHRSETQPPPPEVFADRPFVRNDDVYLEDQFWPPHTAAVTPLGRMRGVELVQVEVPTSQYNPVTHELLLFSNVAINMTFQGGENGFLPEFTESPFESRPGVYTGAVLNREAVVVGPRIPELIAPNLFGEEFIILTHPDFRPAANALAAWKNMKGIVTNVFECGTGSGIAGRQTREEIKAFIDNRYDSTLIKASYILLLGDSEFIQPYLQDGIGTDWPYAIRTYPGQEFPTLVPTFAMGRIPVDTLAQANTVVNKIIAYESDPPGSPSFVGHAFYRNATIAAQFQCCRTDVAQVGVAQRTFAQVAEFSRGVLLSNGYTVQRIYERTVAAAYGGDPTPRRYYDGSLLPADIGPGSGFGWNGTRQDVINAFNAGRFLILHRDHGWHSGWGHPPFNSSNVTNSLNNGELLPVVFSINCSSGLFDNETSPGAEGTTATGVYFAERLLRKAGGGAVGVIGDTRVSPSWPNTALTRGLFDAIWPNALPAFGDNSSKRRLGDILNHAKLYLITQVGVAGQGVSYDSLLRMLKLYHVFGDPTLEIWTKDPNQIVLPPIFEVAVVHPELIKVPYPIEGAEITLVQEIREQLVPIGRGIVSDGEADIEILAEFNAQEPVMVSARLDDSLGAHGEALIEFEIDDVTR